METRSVDGEDRSQLRSSIPKEGLCGRRVQLFKLTDLRIGPLDNGSHRTSEVIAQSSGQQLAKVLLGRSLRQQLKNHEVVVPVRHDSRQCIRLGKDQPA